MKQDAVDRLTRWSPFLLEGGAVAGTAYLALLVFNQFRETLVLLPLLCGLVGATLAGQTKIQAVLRWTYLPLLLAVTLLPFPLALYVDPWRVLPAALLGSLAPLATFAGSRKTRLLLAVPGEIALAFAVLPPCRSLPEAIPRYLTLWLLSALLACLVVRRPPQPARRLGHLAFVVILAAAPALHSRYLPCDERGLAPLAHQEGVEILFDNQTSLDLPANRSELFCDAKTGIRVVTPHSPNKRIGLIDPDGRTRSVLLYSDASLVSSVHDGRLFTAAKGAINALDLVSGEITRGPQLMQHNAGYLHFHPAGETFTLVEDGGSYCHLGRLANLSGAGHASLRLPGDCEMLATDRLLISDLAWPGRRLRILSWPALEVLSEKRLADIGFNQFAVDHARGLLFVPLTAWGEIIALDLETLEEQYRFPTQRGVRQVIVDPAAERLFVWDYFDGEIIEHSLPDGTIGRAWRLGGPLRNVHWDCDGDHLLAVTCLGGFRLAVRP